MEEKKDWLEEALKEMDKNTEYEKKESLKLAQDAPTNFVVSIDQEWRKWQETRDGKIKFSKIIPVVHDGEEKVFWLNVKNPVYTQLLDMAKKAREEGRMDFPVCIFKTGTQQDTKYTIVK